MTSRPPKWIYRRASALEASAAKAQVALLRAVRRSVLAEVGAAVGYRAFHLSQILAALDAEIQAYRARAVSAVGSESRDAASLGAESVDRVVFPSGVSITGPGPVIGFGEELVQAVIDATTLQVTDVWDELGRRLQNTVRRASLGVTDPFQALHQIAVQIEDPKIFGTAENRAEAIMRTEVGRAFDLATHRRMDQANEALDGKLRKWWLAQGGKRTRQTHLDAWHRYRPGGSVGPIPVGQAFEVGKGLLMHPLDPSGPPEETINCRCREVPYLEE